MVDRMQFVGSSPSLGSFALFPLYTPKHFADGAFEWLLGGNLKAYAPEYAELVARHRRLAFVSVAQQTGAGHGANIAKQFYVGTNYVDIPIDSAGTGARYGATPAITSSMTGTYPNTIHDAIKTGGGALVVAGDSASGHFISRSTNGSSLADATGQPGALVQASYSALACNGAEVVLFNDLGTANGIFTSADNGANFTARTPTGGAAGAISFATYCQAIGKYLTAKTATATLYSAANGYTLSAEEIPSLGSATLPSANNGNRNVASKADCTLILLSDGRFLRVTAGPTYEVITPDALATVGSFYSINTDGAKFYASTGASSGHIMSSADNGATWKMEFRLYDATAKAVQSLAYNPPWLANGKYLQHTGSKVFDLTALLAAQTPDYVGSDVSATAPSGSSYFVRIK